MRHVSWLLIVVPLLLSSCSSEEILSKQPPQVIEENPTTVEVEAREPIFVYSAQQKRLPARVVLRLAGEPLLFPSGYVRLAGVVSGGRPMALLEVGGRGLALGEEEKLDDYRVVGIEDDRVLLERGK